MGNDVAEAAAKLSHNSLENYESAKVDGSLSEKIEKVKVKFRFLDDWIHQPPPKTPPGDTSK
jgi:hypothetical protein